MQTPINRHINTELRGGGGVLVMADEDLPRFVEGRYSGLFTPSQHTNWRRGVDNEVARLHYRRRTDRERLERGLCVLIGADLDLKGNGGLVAMTPGRFGKMDLYYASKHERCSVGKLGAKLNRAMLRIFDGDSRPKITFASSHYRSQLRALTESAAEALVAANTKRRQEETDRWRQQPINTGTFEIGLINYEGQQRWLINQPRQQIVLGRMRQPGTPVTQSTAWIEAVLLTESQYADWQETMRPPPPTQPSKIRTSHTIALTTEALPVASWLHDLRDMAQTGEFNAVGDAGNEAAALLKEEFRNIDPDHPSQAPPVIRAAMLALFPWRDDQSGIVDLDNGSRWILGGDPERQNSSFSRRVKIQPAGSTDEEEIITYA